MSEFKIGDRVKYVGKIPEFKGKVGTVMDVAPGNCYGIFLTNIYGFYTALADYVRLVMGGGAKTLIWN